jgi:hypothetical protein
MSTYFGNSDDGKKTYLNMIYNILKKMYDNSNVVSNSELANYFTKVFGTTSYTEEKLENTKGLKNYFNKALKAAYNI